MKTEQQIREKLSRTNSALEMELLLWVLETPDCPLCGMSNRREIEIGIHQNEITPSFLEEKYSWPEGTVMTHMDEHIDYDPVEAQHMEKMRSESIDTLDSAQDIVGRLLGWIDELEQQKDEGEGITSEWVADATKLVAQANTSLRLVGQLKKEIGVDSQLLLAQAQMDNVMGVLVNTLRDQPHLLDNVELQLAALKPPSHIQDVEFEVIE
tara:strand:- start:17586 stop:18215 length:630 start_codon:yes stop_codon:yes gene_type:complete